MTTESEFFRAKRHWSKIKDEILANYLVPYLKKVAKLGQRIVLVDGFAGPGLFEDGTKGSPLIICEQAERTVPELYLAIFVNREKHSHQTLQNTLKDYNLSKENSLYSWYSK
jgi:three-Cys-motif partner protein